MVKLLIWVPETKTGDRNELLLLNEENEVWSHVCVSEEGCPLYECQIKQKGLCFFDRAKRRARMAHVLVVNHSLLLADLAMGGGVLPEYNHLIIDEAHNLEDEATDALGFTVDRTMVMKLLTELSAPPNSLGAADDFLGKLQAAAGERDDEAQDGVGGGGQAGIDAQSDGAGGRGERGAEDNDRQGEGVGQRAICHAYYAGGSYNDEQNVYDLRQRITDEVRRHPTWGQLEVVWDNLGLQLAEIEEGLARITTLVGDVDWDSMPRRVLAERVASYTDVLLELRNNLRGCTICASNANAAIANPEEGAVYWLEARVKGGDVALRCAPLHVGQLLDELSILAEGIRWY